MSHPASKRFPTDTRILVAAVAIAAGLNCLQLEVVGGARVFLGAFVIVPFLLSWPPLWAVVIAMLAMIPSVVILGHPFALLLDGIGAAWLVVTVRYGRINAILAAGAYWLLAGLPLGLWWHAGVAGLPRDLSLVMLVAQCVTEIAAVASGYFILRYTSFGARLSGGRTETATVREVVFNYVFVLSLVPLAFVALGFSILSREAAEAEVGERAFFAAREAVRQIDLFFELNQSTLTGVARVIEQAPETAPLVLEEVKRAHPRFLTMLVTDVDGRIVQTSPASELVRLRGASVADREYFQVARDTLRPFVSGVFLGRGFGNDVLVAMSVPHFDRIGRFAGIVEASVQVERLAQAAATTAEKNRINLVLADSSGRVIHADEPTGLRSMQRLQDTALVSALKAGAGLTPFFSDRFEPGAGKRRVLNRAERCRTVGMLVIAQWPVLGALEGMKTPYLLMIAILVGISGSAALVARAAHRRLSAPLENFSNHTAQQTEAGAVALLPPFSGTAPREVLEMFAAFNRLASRLNATHDELRRQNVELDRRVAERTLEAETARRQAEAASQSKTDFLAMTGHEIRTPLNAMIGLADVVAKNPSDPASAARVRTIRDSSARLLGVVNDLLDLSRAEAGRIELKPKPVELGELCAELRALFSLKAEQLGLRLRFTLPAVIPLWLEIDAPRLHQVLINLIGNALKFTKSGSITVRIDLVGSQGPELELRFAVIDTGPGIAAAEQAKLFQPYVQLPGAASATQPGTGLGLSISRRLVGLFGGELAVRSAPGEGSEFFFSLLVRHTRPPESAAPVAPVAEPTALRILAADDNLTNQEVLRGLLEGDCRHLETVSSGREALQLLQEGKFDAALIDLEMPDMDGLEVVRTYRAWSDTTGTTPCRLVAFSAHGRTQMWERCAAAGFDDFVEKPIDPRQLLRALTTRSTTTPTTNGSAG